MKLDDRDIMCETDYSPLSNEEFGRVWKDLLAVARLAGYEVVSDRERARRQAQAYIDTRRRKKGARP